MGANRRKLFGRMAPAVIAAVLVSTGAAASPDPGADECGVPPDSEACPEWSARYRGGNRSGTNTAKALAVSPDGATVFVAGDVFAGAAGRDVAVVAYDAATGTERWAVEHDEGGSDVVTGAAISPDGATVFTTGPSDGDTQDFLTLALDAANGAVRWKARLDGGGPSDHPWAITHSAIAERVYVTGYVDQGPEQGDRNFATVAYDAASGQELWIATYDGPTGGGDVARAVAVATYEDDEEELRERVIVTGRSGGAVAASPENDYATVAYDADTGQELWAARYDGPAEGRDYPIGLAVSPEHETVYVSGESWIEGPRYAYATVAYDAATGEQRWVSRFDRGDEEIRVQQIFLTYSPPDATGHIAVHPSGDALFVTGQSFPMGLSNYRRPVTFALDASTGDEIWSVAGEGPLSESSLHVATSPDGGSVHIAGQSGGSFGCFVGLNTAIDQSACSDVSGFLALSLDAETGGQRWIARGDMAASDARHAATALSPDGSMLFLAGLEFNDFRTVAYRT